VVAPEAVIWAYRLILGREPESNDVVERHCRHLENVGALRRGFFESEEFARQHLRERLPRVWVIAPVMRGERLMWVDLGDRFVSFGCLFDSYEPLETHFVTTVLRLGDVFIDIGANVGWFSMLASTIVGAEGRVYAFEPRAETAGYLEKTIILNGLQSQVTLHQFGLSDTEEHRLLVWTRDTENPGGSFVVDRLPSSEMESQAIALRPLDALGLQRVDFMKIDVEGAEMRVFRGAQATLDRCRPVILSELSPEMLKRGSEADTEAIFSLFKQINYRIFIINPHRYGEEVSRFPREWVGPLANFAMVPNERIQNRRFADFPRLGEEH
jgi:FkbM family methyltransferase